MLQPIFICCQMQYEHYSYLGPETAIKKIYPYDVRSTFDDNNLLTNYNFTVHNILLTFCIRRIYEYYVQSAVTISKLLRNH